MLPPFADLAAAPEPQLDLLALALAREFREVDASSALATLDLLGSELLQAAQRTDRTPDAEARVCGQTLGGACGFEGDQRDYDHPDNSMLDLVLARRRGLPILLSAVYIEVARRARIELAGVGLPGHFVVGHFGTEPPLLLDPFRGGQVVSAEVPRELLRPWPAHEILMRMLNNLVVSFTRRGDLGAAIRAAEMRTALPAAAGARLLLRRELQALRSRLN